MNVRIAQTEEIVGEVINVQKLKGYTDEEMAKFLNCSRQTYQRTRTKKIPVRDAFFSGAIRFLESPEHIHEEGRKASIKRETKETNINLELNIDGTGKWEIATGIHIFDHLLSALAKHGLFDIKIQATGDDPHHLVEDVAICLGQAFGQALGDKEGIVRMAEASVPMDDALAVAVVDLSGRGYAVLDLSLTGNDLSGFPPDLIRHFLESFAFEARMNLHARILYGRNDHHKAEALFKALGRALDAATRIDPRIAGELPTTKGFLER
jgi:imidazoleglycerol-phosphate dehydratase